MEYFIKYMEANAAKSITLCISFLQRYYFFLSDKLFSALITF